MTPPSKVVRVAPLSLQALREREDFSQSCMSRTPQFPTTSSASRSRKPPPTKIAANGYRDYQLEDAYGGMDYPAPTTPTHQFAPASRPYSHAESASSEGSNLRNNPGGAGPARPLRSELRARQLSQSSNQYQPPSNLANNTRQERDVQRQYDRDQYGNSNNNNNNNNYGYTDYSESERARELNTSRSVGGGLRTQAQAEAQMNYGYGGSRSDHGEWDQSQPPVPRTRYPQDRGGGGGSGGGSSLKDGRYGMGSGGVVVEEPDASPLAINAAITAFQAAAGRKRSMTNGTDELAPYEIERQREREKEKERAQMIQKRQMQRSMNGRKARPGDVDAVLDQIEDEWEYVVDPEFNPVTLALSLVDDSLKDTPPARGQRSLESFRRTKRMLEKALRGTVDKHYQSFNAALPHHASLLSSMTKVQTEIADARQKLQDTRTALGSKRTDLVQLWSRGQTLEEMFRLLDEIEHLKNVPDILETLISEKQLLQASILLVRSLKLISKGDMMEIGALLDLRSYLTGQETALRDILVEELHSHLYLKAFWCDSRWTPYDPNSQNGFLVSDSEQATSAPNSNNPDNPTRQTRLDTFLDDLALRPTNETPFEINDDLSIEKSQQATLNSLSSSISLSTSIPNSLSNNQITSLSSQSQPPQQQNPESDSLTYIEMLVESLAVLGKLGSGLDAVAQRLPIEIHSLVEVTIDEVSERSEFGKRASMPAGWTASASGGGNGRRTSMYVFSQADRSPVVSASTLRLTAFESPAKAADWESLKDLFWTLYSKLDAVIQGLRVVYEVANRIGSRRDFRDSAGAKAGTLFPLVELWMPIQNEVRGLLHDYLTDDERGATSGRNPIASINEVLRENRFGRDKSKPVFRLADADNKTTSKALKKHEEELTRILKESVPGLVNGPTETAVQAFSSLGGMGDGFAGGTGTAGSLHRLLIKPDAFHVTVLFQPTLAFSERLAKILPAGMSDATKGSSALLDDFVLKVYLPQLEEKVTSLFHHAAGTSDAWVEDPASRRLSPKPLVRGCTQLMALINSLCIMRQSTPFHRENYSRLILDTIIRFYQRCYDRFVELVTLSHTGQLIDAEAHISVSARWAQKPEVTACLSGLYATPLGDDATEKRLCRQETRVELNFLTTETISTNDLIQSTKNISALGTLYQSLTWFIKQLQELKTLDEGVTSPSDPNGVAPPPPVRKSSVAQDHLSPPNTPKLELPLSRPMSLRYDALLKTYEQLAELVLHSIRIDIRCRIIHFLDLALRQGNYRIENEAGEPDPHIIDLNTDLNACEESTSVSLEERERRFIFRGLGTLMEHLLISNARHLRFANKLGIQKIFKNILALQQNLKTLSDLPEDAEFARARKYYELFLLTPVQMIESVRKRSYFSFEEYRAMLNLQCGVDQTAGDTGVTDPEYNRSLTELHSLVVDEWDNA